MPSPFLAVHFRKLNRWPLGTTGEAAACQARRRRRRLCCQSLPRLLLLHRTSLPLFIVVDAPCRGIFPPLDHSGDREGGDHPARRLSNEAIPQDLDGRRPVLAMARRSGDFVVGPNRVRAGCPWWGLTSDGLLCISHVAWEPPRHRVSPRSSLFCTLLPPPSSLPHYLLLIVSGERLSFRLPVCLVFFFAPSLSLFLCLSTFYLSLLFPRLFCLPW